MKNWTFKTWNTGLGWAVFAIALVTYFSTMEPNFSFWDCGEYISSAVKLEVTHAPGAALFQLCGAVASMFAFGNGHHYSVVINGMSALFSAFTILFLFWTITHLLRRLLKKEFEEVSGFQEISILFAGVIGALSFTFSDTFWFSAVEGEVYAMASMFIALLVWLITKWENEYHAPDNERWIILIFFIIGLSVGVHMMCMLAIPCICLVYYARNYEFSWKSFIWANVITLIILGIVFKGIFPLIMTLFGKVERFAVNGLGMPFHSGTVIAFIITIALCFFAIKYARKSGKNLFQTIALSVVYMIIGFSCWMVIPIRANANPPMNLNDPDNAIGMLDYYNREQYGDWPTSYGQNYTYALDFNGLEKNIDEYGNEGGYKTIKTGDVYEKDEKAGIYRKTSERFDYVYSPDHVSFFPRMFDDKPEVMENYISMYGAPDFTLNPEYEGSPEAEKIYDELRKKFKNKTIKVDDYLDAKRYDLLKVQRPSFAQNFDYFITFQNAYYFGRYLLWNFVGRQNDLEGSGGITAGNWISGIKFIDEQVVGNTDNAPKKFYNESTVKFFFLPLLLGLIGFFFQFNRDFKRFYAVFSLFILAGVGIVYYTGMKPYEVRERDYAVVGSFYVFAIWIGLGAGAILSLLQTKIKSSAAIFVFGILLLGIPLMMGFQNYVPHDRSQRYTAYDYAYSTLKSLPKNDIMFIYGDNDTFPIWAIQETERFRDDVKTVNFTLLSTTWYIDQMKRKTYNSPPVPSVLKHEEYRDGTNDQIYMLRKNDWKEIFESLDSEDSTRNAFPEFRKFLTQDSMTMKEAVDFLRTKSEDKDDILKMFFGDDKYEKMNFLPVSKFVLPVNKQNALNAGTITKKDLPNVVDFITINYKSRSMFKNNLLQLDILANNDWKRPIHFSSGGIYDPENIFYLGNYLQFTGFSYKLVPIKTPETSAGDTGRVDADELYQIVKNFKWGNFKNLNVHFDETCTQNIIGYRSSVGRAAEALALSGQKQKAIEILDLASREIPAEKYNSPQSLSSIVYGYIVAGQEQTGLKLAEKLKKEIFEEYDYYINLAPEHQRFLGRQIRTKPLEYSMVVGAVADAYKKIGQESKGYDYVLKSTEPIDKRFNEFIKDLQTMGKEKAMRESEEVSKITPFYQYLFEITDDYDSTYSKEKYQQIMDAVIKATE
ncbi:MAG: DUF2723 domain-containing protein [Flavobacteriaceae bacterium]|jgi:hypothetical protein|nr:DUF2723 domain-containing protein [Flavobacteriaceae bacterium]